MELRKTIPEQNVLTVNRLSKNRDPIRNGHLVDCWSKQTLRTHFENAVKWNRPKTKKDHRHFWQPVVQPIKRHSSVQNKRIHPIHNAILHFSGQIHTHLRPAEIQEQNSYIRNMKTSNQWLEWVSCTAGLSDKDFPLMLQWLSIWPWWLHFCPRNKPNSSTVDSKNQNSFWVPGLLFPQKSATQHTIHFMKWMTRCYSTNKTYMTYIIIF